MLIDALRKANIEALKNRDKDRRAIYSVVINRYDLLAKEKAVNDGDLASIIAKVNKELDEEKEGYVKTNNAEGIRSIEVQKLALTPFLPKTLSEEEIKAEIMKLEDKSVKNVMLHFKTNFQGRVDMGKVNQILKTLWNHF